MIRGTRFQGNVEREGLVDVAKHLEEEARMVLPGIQALFGFQLIAVFNQRFTELTVFCQHMHFFALLSTAISVVLVMVPAAYHRLAEPRQISDYFCELGSRALMLSLLPLAVAISLDLYVIAKLLFVSDLVAIASGAGFFACSAGAWFVFPRMGRMKGESHASLARRRAG